MGTLAALVCRGKKSLANKAKVHSCYNPSVKLFKDQRGVGFIVVIIIAVLAIGTVGLFTYRAYQTQKAANSKKTEISVSTHTEKGETADWASFTSSSAKLTFKYPADWSSKSCSDNDMTSVYLAPPGTSQAVCNSEKGAEILVSSMAGNHRSINATDYAAIGTSVSKQAVTIDGVAGQKVSYTANGDDFIPAETKQVTYEFFTNGRTYIASYVQKPNDPDVLSDFELLVTKTLKFS